MTQQKRRLATIKTEYERRYAEWEQDRKQYIAEHGLEAWTLKVDREIEELYPIDKPVPGNRDYTK